MTSTVEYEEKKSSKKAKLKAHSKNEHWLQKQKAEKTHEKRGHQKRYLQSILIYRQKIHIEKVIEWETKSIWHSSVSFSIYSRIEKYITRALYRTKGISLWNMTWIEPQLTDWCVVYRLAMNSTNLFSFHWLFWISPQ